MHLFFESLICWLFEISAFSRSAQSRSAPWTSAPDTPGWHTRQCPWFSVVSEAMHQASLGPLKGELSAQSDHQGSKTETRELLEGTKENSITPDNLPFRPINDFQELEKNCVSGHWPTLFHISWRRRRASRYHATQGRHTWTFLWLWNARNFSSSSSWSGMNHY